MDGLRAETAYTVQPIDCGGTIIPAYMDVDDAKWDDDPRVKHWRREIQLGHMPRRETPKTVQPNLSAAAASISTPRDPRLRSDVSGGSDSQYTQPASMVMSTLQQQQQHIQQMVQHLMQHGTSTSESVTAATVLPPTGPVTASATYSLTAVNPILSPFPQLYRPDSSVNPLSATGQASSVSLPSVSVEQPVPVNTLQHDAVVSFSAEVSSSAVISSSKSLSPITHDVQQPFKVPAPISSNENCPSAIDVVSDEKETSSDSEQRKLDPRFKKRKSKSSNKSVFTVSDSKLPTSESAVIETIQQDTDVMQFQSPLAAADNTRLSMTSSGYNRPPNKRYQQLLQQRNQQPTRDRYSSDQTQKLASEIQQLGKTSSVHSVLALPAVVTYPGIVSQDALSSNSLAKGSLKDMFKTIDPTASPFC